MIYKIRNQEGLFSKGGSKPRFSEKGKTWNGEGQLKLHLVFIVKSGNPLVYKDCEIVEYEVIEKKCIDISIELHEIEMRKKRK